MSKTAARCPRQRDCELSYRESSLSSSVGDISMGGVLVLKLLVLIFDLIEHLLQLLLRLWFSDELNSKP